MAPDQYQPTLPTVPVQSQDKPVIVRSTYSAKAHALAARPRLTIAEAAEAAGKSRSQYFRELKRAAQAEQAGGSPQHAHMPPQKVTATLEQDWGGNALMAQTRLTEALDVGDMRAAQSAAITAGIATEKVLLMQGRPTVITAQVHEHRHDLARIYAALASAMGTGTAQAALPPAATPGADTA